MDEITNEKKDRLIAYKATAARHKEIVEFVDDRGWKMSKFLDRAVQESMDKVVAEENKKD